MKRVLLILFILTLSGCATVQDAKNAKGTGSKAQFSASYDEVWDESVKIIDESNLDLIDDDKDDGEILAQKGMSLASYGENVAMFVEQIEPEVTAVEVVSKRSLATNIFARDWSYYILDKLREKFTEINTE